jgi:uncharacterized membrane protein
MFVYKINYMTRNNEPVPANGIIILFLVLINVIAIKEGFIGNGKWYLVLILGLPLLLLAIANMRQKR